MLYFRRRARHSLAIEHAEVHGSVGLDAPHEPAHRRSERGAEIRHGGHEVPRHCSSSKQSLFVFPPVKPKKAYDKACAWYMFKTKPEKSAKGNKIKKEERRKKQLKKGSRRKQRRQTNKTIPFKNRGTRYKRNPPTPPPAVPIRQRLKQQAAPPGTRKHAAKWARGGNAAKSNGSPARTLPHPTLAHGTSMLAHGTSTDDNRWDRFDRYNTAPCFLDDRQAFAEWGHPRLPPIPSSPSLRGPRSSPKRTP